MEITIVDDKNRIDTICGYIGNRFLHGDDNVVQNIYGHAWQESPPLLKTISLLQGNLTSVEIGEDIANTYSPRFLYYWGMICLGEESPLIIKELETAKACFRKIRHLVPMVNARLAYIGLLQSAEPAKSDDNVMRLDTLRKWANKRDLFSMIALSKIVFYSFLREQVEDDPERPISKLPVKATSLLDLPYKKGHPVAIRFRNEIMDFVRGSETLSTRSWENDVVRETLYDFQIASNMQIV